MTSFVYIATNLKDGSQYVGVSDRPYKRWREHIHGAINGLAYGITKVAVIKRCQGKIPHDNRRSIYLDFEYVDSLS